MTRLRAGTGDSTAADATTAGQEAAQTALATLDGEPPALVMMFASVRYPVAEVAAGVRSVTPDATLVGATSSGHFHDGVLSAPGEGVVVLALTAGPYHFGTASVTGIGADPFTSGVAVARAARAEAGPNPGQHSAVLLLTAGMALDAQELLSGIYAVGGAGVPVVGGAAGDDKQLRATSVIHDGVVSDDAAVAVWIASDRPLRVRAGHGWEPISDPLMVTVADGHVLHQLGGRPAAEVYSEAVSEHAENGPVTGWTGGTWHAAHALGLIEPDGSHVIRGAFKDENDVLSTFVPLPPYAAVQVVTSSPDSLLDVVDTLVPDTLGDAPADVVLGFSCVARLDILAERGVEEAKRFQAAAGDLATFGFYSYGEFARTVGVTGVHNATLAVLAL